MLPAGVSKNSFETPAGSNLGEHYKVLLIQSSAPDDWLKHLSKHVELTWNNKLIYKMHLVGYFHNYPKNLFVPEMTVKSPIV